MKAEAGTSCTLTIAWWDGDRPVEGDFLRTAAGSCYRIDEAHAHRFVCTRLDRDAVQLGGPGVWAWTWKPRRRKTTA